jgi:hypothetical protein
MPALPALQTRPRLSIVLISVGPVSFLDRALKMVLETQFYLETELVVVRICGSEEERAYLFRLSRQYSFSLELAPAGGSRDILADLGSRRASGDILTVKDDHVLSDDLWLSPFALPVEKAAWDSEVARTGSELVDRPAGGIAKPVASAPLADRVASPPRQHGAAKRPSESATELNA